MQQPPSPALVEDDDASTCGAKPFERRRVDQKALGHPRPEHVFSAQQGATAEPQGNLARRRPSCDVNRIAYMIPDDKGHCDLVVTVVSMTSELEMPIVQIDNPVETRSIESVAGYAAADRGYVDAPPNEGGEHAVGEAISSGVLD
jgi:hypothetical protein